MEVDRTSKADIGGKTTKMKLNLQDLEPTRTTPLWRNMWICKALQELEELKLLCIDTGMSYSERVEECGEEIHAFAACFVHLG